MKTMKILLSSFALITITGLASARDYNRDYIYAPVVDVQPYYETVRVPQNRRVCKNSRDDYRRDDYRREDYHNRRGYSSHRSNDDGALLGGIIGGIIGNRFGKGNGRRIATAAGVLAGAAIGSNSKHHGDDRPYRNEHRRHCYTKRDYYTEQRLAGYDVSYEYIGRVYHTKMHNHPGDKVRVNVTVAAYDD